MEQKVSSTTPKQKKTGLILQYKQAATITVEWGMQCVDPSTGNFQRRVLGPFPEIPDKLLHRRVPFPNYIPVLRSGPVRKTSEPEPALLRAALLRGWEHQAEYSRRPGHREKTLAEHRVLQLPVLHQIHTSSVQVVQKVSDILSKQVLPVRATRRSWKVWMDHVRIGLINRLTQRDQARSFPTSLTVDVVRVRSRSDLPNDGP